MTHQQVLNVILKVSSKIARKFPIPGYEPDDIQQECFLLAIDALERYNEELPLENFLSVHLRLRIINFRRDKYLRKKDLHDAANIDFIKNEILSGDHSIGEFECAEIWDKIDRELPPCLREDYLRLLDGVSIPTKRKNKLLAALDEICRELVDFLKKT
jgi:DNA-directed RNA polymerase specialized sigma24 family protein